MTGPGASTAAASPRTVTGSEPSAVIGQAMTTGATAGLRGGPTELDHKSPVTHQEVIPRRPHVRDTLSHL
ncbi:hypothetical protein GCM10009700_01590 [Brevibacterium sanguinis]